MSFRSVITFLVAILAIDAFVFIGAMIFGISFIALFIAFISVGAAAFLVTSIYAVFRGAPYVPTDKRNVDEMMKMANVQSGEHVVDLGSGDGRILIAAAKAGAIAEGWEINPWLWLISVLMIRRAGVAHCVKVHWGSYWGENVNFADTVFLFLIDTQMKKMQKKLQKELRSGSKVVSYVFKFPDWEVAEDNGKGVRLYIQT